MTKDQEAEAVFHQLRDERKCVKCGQWYPSRDTALLETKLDQDITLHLLRYCSLACFDKDNQAGIVKMRSKVNKNLLSALFDVFRHFRTRPPS